MIITGKVIFQNRWDSNISLIFKIDSGLKNLKRKKEWIDFNFQLLLLEKIYIELSWFRVYNKNLECCNCLKIICFVLINKDTPFLAVIKGTLRKVTIVLEK